MEIDQGSVPAEHVEKQLLLVLEEFRSAMIVLEDFQPDSQGHFHGILNSLLANCTELDNLHLNSSFWSEPLIPLDIVNFVDDGNNPDLFREQKRASQADLLNSVKENQEALHLFRRELMASLSEVYPEEIKEYENCFHSAERGSVADDL